jgi:hypothetical protein
MPPEYYLGIAIAVILIVLLGSLLRRWLGTRSVVRHKKSSGTDQVANQLSRIADSLERLVAHLEPSPPVEKPPVPLQNAVEPSNTDQRKIDEPSKRERHINLSMFGR